VGDHPDPDVNLALLADSLSTGDLVFARMVMHGMATNEAIAERKAFAELIRRSRRSLALDL
jgi:hypothetical protein